MDTEIEWDNIVNLMNDDTREKVHSIMPIPCSPITFLKLYLKEDNSFNEILAQEFRDTYLSIYRS